MKTKLLLGFASIVLFASCIHDFHGGGEEIEFTEKNYIYEGDLYRIYLETEIEELDVQIQELEDIIANDKGDQKTQEELDKTNNQKNQISEDLRGIISLEQVGLKLPPPPPPCPSPRNCDFSQLEHILVDNRIQEMQISFYDKNENLIGGGDINELSPLPNVMGQINYSNLEISSNNEPVAAIQVSVKNIDSEEYTYLVK